MIIPMLICEVFPGRVHATTEAGIIPMRRPTSPAPSLCLLVYPNPKNPQSRVPILLPSPPPSHPSSKPPSPKPKIEALLSPLKKDLTAILEHPEVRTNYGSKMPIPDVAAVAPVSGLSTARCRLYPQLRSFVFRKSDKRMLLPIVLFCRVFPTWGWFFLCRVLCFME